MIKSIFQNPFHGVIACSLLQWNRWCNVSEYICQISLFSQSHVSQKWSICIYYDTSLHLLWSKRSSLWSDNIACNWKDSFTFTACHWDCKDNPDQKSKKRKCFLVVLPPIQLVNVWGSIWDNLFICWALILEPSCGCGGDDENDKDWWKWCDLTSTRSKNKNPEKSRRNFWTIPGLKIRVNPVPKNPGIPGFGKIPSRKIPGLKILIPLGPDSGWCWAGDADEELRHTESTQQKTKSSPS